MRQYALGIMGIMIALTALPVMVSVAYWLLVNLFPLSLLFVLVICAFIIRHSANAPMADQVMVLDMEITCPLDDYRNSK